MKFLVQQFTIDGFKLAEREYRTEKGAMRAAAQWRNMFPLAPIRIVGRPDNHLEEGFVREVPPVGLK